MTSQQGHTVLVGYGSIGHWIGEALSSAGVPLFVIEEKDDVVAKLKARGIEAVAGSAPAALAAANLAQARALLVAVPEAFEAGQIVAQARAANRDLFIVAHAHSDTEAAYLSNYGASIVVQGAREIAATMVAQLPPAHLPCRCRRAANRLAARPYFCRFCSAATAWNRGNCVAGRLI